MCWSLMASTLTLGIPPTWAGFTGVQELRSVQLLLPYCTSQYPNHCTMEPTKHSPVWGLNLGPQFCSLCHSPLSQSTIDWLLKSGKGLEKILRCCCTSVGRVQSFPSAFFQVLLCNPLCTLAYTIASWRFFRERIEEEELSLIHFFAEDYIEYKKKVPTGLPFISGIRVN